MRTLAAVLALSACAQEPAAKPHAGKVLEVEDAKPAGIGFRKHETLVLASAPGDLGRRAEMLLKKKDPEPLKAGDDVRLYLLFGSSGSGLDDLRKTRVEVRFDEGARTFHARIRSRKTLDLSDFAGITDVQYVGFGAKAGALAPGDYTVKVYETVSTCKTPADPAPVAGPETLVRELTFAVR